MAKLGLTTSKSGNVSMRLERDGVRELMAITPTGKPYAALAPGDIAVVDFDIEPAEEGPPPSSEALMHAGIYRARADVGAVMHTHSVFASAVAVSGLGQIPSIIDEMVVYLGGAVQVSEYAFPGTQEMADNVLAALAERNAALIKNHGVVGLGRDLDEALEVCELTERLAEVHHRAVALGGAEALPEDVVEAEAAIYKMRSLGQRPSTTARQIGEM